MKRLAAALAALMALSAPASAQYPGFYRDRGYGDYYERDYYERRPRRSYDYDDDDDFGPRRNRRDYREERRDYRDEREYRVRPYGGSPRAGGTCVTPRGSCPTGQPVATGTRCFCRTGPTDATPGTVR